MRAPREAPALTRRAPRAAAVDTVKIRAMLDHVQAHHKDQTAKRKLTKLINHRKSIMKYLKRTDLDLYTRLLAEMDLPDMVSGATRMPSARKI